MAKANKKSVAKRKQSTVKKVMKKFKRGSLKSGPKGAGGKVKSRKQAIAIALSESGQSKKKARGKMAKSSSGSGMNSNGTSKETRPSRGGHSTLSQSQRPGTGRRAREVSRARSDEDRAGGSNVEKPIEDDRTELKEVI